MSGRYVCSDCGKEIPESEINQGDWGQGSFGGEKVVPAPGASSISEQLESIDSDLELESEQAEVKGPEHEIEATELQVENKTEDVGFFPALESQSSDPAILSGDAPASVTTAEVQQVTKEEKESDLAPSPVASLLPMGGEPLAENPEIYQDPLYELPLPAENSPKSPSTKTTMTESRRTNLIILVGGAVLTLVLLAAGIWGYQVLSRGADLAAGDLGTDETVLDCNAEGKEDEKNSCIAESYAKCTLASWSGNFDSDVAGSIDLGYQIRGIVENSCEVEATLDKNPEDATKEGQSMVCSLGSTLTAPEALASINGTTCSGNLADYLFPLDEFNVEESSADTAN